MGLATGRTAEPGAVQRAGRICYACRRALLSQINDWESLAAVNQRVNEGAGKRQGYHITARTLF